jgi:ApaG protein
MPETLTQLSDLTVSIDGLEHAPHLEAPPDRPHPYIYSISIHNRSSETVTIKGRKWVVTDCEGQTVVVEGDGVVGKFPRLEPGMTFSYQSYHVIGCDSVAEGAFFGVTDDGVQVYTRIPPFAIRVPQTTSGLDA